MPMGHSLAPWVKLAVSQAGRLVEVQRVPVAAVDSELAERDMDFVEQVNVKLRCWTAGG
jgi:hypothetical protein